MSDTLPTIWEAEPHTIVKHKILQRYLSAWLPILTRQARLLQQQHRQILFIDGFAGPGIYKNQEPGSPVIAVKTALDHSVEFPVPVEMMFVELDGKRHASLKTILAPLIEAANKTNTVHVSEPIRDDCENVISGLLNQGRNFGPALAFLDQFGYGAVSMELVKGILACPQCEVFTYLGYTGMNRWISDDTKAEVFTRAFGDEAWRECINLPPDDRRSKLLELYIAALKKHAKVNYVVQFLMYDSNDSPLYWQLFCTNSLKGLEEMKKAMWKVDGTGDFKFSDSDSPDQLSLLSVAFDQTWLADELCRRLGGRTLSVKDVHEFVLTQTPCYLFKKALQAIETSKRLDVIASPVGRKPGTYPEDCWEMTQFRFQSSLF